MTRHYVSFKTIEAAAAIHSLEQRGATIVNRTDGPDGMTGVVYDDNE